MATLLIASGTNHNIVTSADGGVTWVTKQADDSSGALLADQAWDGGQNYVLVGNGSGIWSSDNGGTTFAQRVAAGTTLSNPSWGIATLFGATGVPKPVIWDGTQFVAVGWRTVSTGPTVTQGVVGTSPDGKTWTFVDMTPSNTGQLLSVQFNGTTYVAMEWDGFIIAQKSRFYSATNPLGPWTLVFTSATEIEYGGLYCNGSAFIAFSTTNPVAAYSVDGNTWAENATAIVPVTHRYSVFWDNVSDLWVIVGTLPDSNYGISTTPTGAVFTTRYDQGIGTFTGTPSAIVRGPANALFVVFCFGANPSAAIPHLFRSVDEGLTWFDQGANGLAQDTFNDIVWTGALFNSLHGLGPAGGFAYGLYSSPDGLNDWVQGYDDTANADLLIVRFYTTSTPPPPPPAVTCIPIEWQSLSILVNEGQYAMVQRIFIDIDCNGQVITPTLLVDENLTPSEYVMPNITNTERGAIEIPFQRKAKILAVRLNACVTARVEWFGWAIDIRPTQP